MPLTSVRVNTFVIDPRRGHTHRARRGEHLALAVIAIAHHQPVPVLIKLTGMSLDVGGDLSPQRCGQHLAGTVADNLIEQRPRRASILVG
ncbi:hypothetical protein MTY66_54210 [Mycolicibacterium sp. TY66]|nr:hypothetical protein MTY66_31350 [Mycolicibacterium sp. TY66]BCI83796.1 hypothetical protein MTY66_54210 [Mycolicibacterium sp. TY66]